MQEQFSLQGKIALITGGVSGIGLAMATALGRAGATLVFNARSKDAVIKAEQNYRSMNLNAYGYVCDVTNEKQVQEMVTDVAEKLGDIDILVNNAGIIKRIPALDMSVEDFSQVVNIDLTGPFIVSKAVAPGMIKKGGGKIINVCSMMSELGRETLSAYASAKGGLKMLTKNLACEWGEYNIQVNGIGPGYIETSLTGSLQDKNNPFNDFIVARTPAARWGTPEDLAGPTVFLASEASNFVNGHILYVDGGLLAYIGKQQ